MPAAINRVGEFVVRWGESLRWDDVRQRLYFVDCAKKTLHWLEGGEPPLHTLQLDSLPTGLVLTGGRQLVICLDGGLHVVDPDTGRSDLLVAYPDGMYGRANDANADDSGNVVTGTLNLGPGPGAFWWFSAAHGWRLLDASATPTVRSWSTSRDSQRSSSQTPSLGPSMPTNTTARPEP